MEDQFVTYEIALDLRELGFNEDCLGAFVTKDRGFSIVDTTTEFELSNFLCQTENVVLAPLWQQCLDWFREKHDIHINFESLVKDNNYVYTFDVLYTIETIKLFSCKMRYETFSEARKQAILKAIDIIKNQTK